MQDLRVVFMGTPEFSVPILEMLIKNTNVIGVVSQPDRIVGRKREIVYSEIKKIALQHNIPIFQPEKIRIEYQDILALEPDIIVTCAYGQIIPEIILKFPKYGCINVHASLLPKLRGGAPIHHAILDGYKKTGITIMYMDKGMDTGDMIKKRSIPILEDDTYESLHDKLKTIGPDLLLETLPLILNGTNERIKQDNEEATYGYNIRREEEVIDFNLNVKEVYNKIRGLNPIPGSYFILNGKTVKVYGAKIIEGTYQNKKNGEIIKLEKDAILIKANDGIIAITDIKYEGKKRMLVKEFLNGNKEIVVGQLANKE